MNQCQFGHGSHDTKVVDTVQGPFTIYDWERYRGLDGYCPGQDDVSMTLDLYGSWEPEDWERVRTSDWAPGVALDFGSHIGWYAITLAQLGHRVYAVDADPVNCELLAINARNRGYEIAIICSWVRDVACYQSHVRFIKSDVEGYEDEVLARCWQIIEEQHPPMLLECSPEFAPYYPDMIRSLIDLGYHASAGPELESQTNVWFT